MKSRIAVLLFGICCSLLQTGAWAEEPNMKLKEVVVTATKTEKEPQDVTQSVTVITADEIKKSGALTAAQAIERTVGVDLRDAGPVGAKTEISLRGSTAAQVLVLLDGRRMNSPQSGSFDFSTLPVPLEEIERIEIVRGASSALYGADAVGGVINIITKRPQTLESFFTGEGGSHGYWRLGAGNAATVRNVFYSLSANKEKSGGYRVNSDYDASVANGKVGYLFSRDSSIELAANYIEKEIGAPGPIKMPTSTARQWNRNAEGALTFKSRLTKDVDLRFVADAYRDKLLYKSTGTDSRHITSGVNTEMQANWLAAPTSFLTNLLSIGTEIKADHLNSRDSGEHSTSLWGVYVQDEISIGESFILVLGSRYDSHSVYGNQFDPRASARYLLSKTGTIFRASAGRSFRAPTFNDLYWPNSSETWFGITYVTKGNPALKPETAEEYELGIEQPIGKNVLKLTGFNRNVKNLIQWQETVTATSDTWQPANVGEARISGYEAEAKFQLFDAVVWAINYAYMDTVDRETGAHILGVPAEQLKSYINITIPKIKTNIYLDGRYVRNYWIAGATNPSSHYVVSDVKISQPVALGSYLRADLFASVKNITNRSYQVSGGYPMPPTEVFGGLTLRF